MQKVDENAEKGSGLVEIECILIAFSMLRSAAWVQKQLFQQHGKLSLGAPLGSELQDDGAKRPRRIRGVAFAIVVE